MWVQYIAAVILIVASREVWGREQCVCSQLHHPQDKLCLMDFAYRVQMIHGEDSNQPGEADEGQRFSSHWKYTAEVIEVFKGAEFLPENITKITTEIYTPSLGFCGRVFLYDDDKKSNQYLVTGTIEKSRFDVIYKAITSCTWVDRWKDLTREQKTGLRVDYHQCNCTAFAVSGELLSGEPARNRFRVENCIYNPVTAINLKVPDCETLYGYCDQNKRGWGCHWRSTDIYRQCYNERRVTLADVGQPAISVKQDCKLYTGRKRKMCIIKFRKAHRRLTRRRWNQ